MTALKYVNLAAPVLLTNPVNGSALTLTVGSTSSFPEPPFLLGIDRGTPDEEVVLCTEKTSTTFTVTRGYDDTTGVAHAIGALVEHTTSAIVHRRAGVATVTTSERDGLSGVNLWTGRMVFNTSTGKPQFWTGSAWINVGPAPGTMAPYGGSSAPINALLCDGGEYSRTTYADLFNAIGVAFGNGDGSTTFNVPDLRQRFPLGKADSGTGDEIGESGGSIDHTHAGASHTHSFSDTSTSAGTHSHSNPNVNSNGNHNHSAGRTGGGVPTQEHIAIDSRGLAAMTDIRDHTHFHSGGEVTSDASLGAERTWQHDHSAPTTGSDGNHNHSQGSTGSSGNHNHSVSGTTGASGTDDTGEANPPYLVTQYIIYT